MRARTVACRKAARYLAGILALAGAPAEGDALTRCKAAIARDGSIVVSAAGVVGTPRWGRIHGEETEPFDGVGTCLQGRLMRRCALAPPGAPARTDPPAACTLYLRDDGPVGCSTWIRRCRPSSEPLPCELFPPDNIWRRDVSAMPVHPMSSTWLARIGPDEPLRVDVGSGLYRGGVIGIPYVVIGPTQPLVPIGFRYADESDPGPYPIPAVVPVEGGGIRPNRGRGDAHILLVQKETCRLWEIFGARAVQRGRAWEAGSGAVFDLRSNALRPDGWTSADAAGLPILAGLIRYDEILRGEIDHALRFTVPRTQRAYVWPARHFASTSSDPALPPMGIRVRLKASFDATGFSRTNRIILEALKRYGMILADNGGFFIGGAPDRRWDNDELRALLALRPADFEVVDVSSLMVHPDSGATR